MFNKKTYTSIFRFKTIDAYAYLNSSYKTLNLDDINRLKKKICLTDINIKYDDFGLEKDLNMNFNVGFEIGDVVSYEQWNSIIVEKKDDNRFIIVPINNYDFRYSYIDFSKSRIDYSSAKEVEKSSFSFVNSIVKSQMLIIMKEYNEYITRKNLIINSQNKKLDRGCLINAFGSLYYVYGIEGKVANSFALKKSQLVDETICIAGKRFMPYYEDTKDIDIKLDSYQILSVASEMEMDNIKEARKNYRKSQKELNSSIPTKKSYGGKISLVCLKSDKMSRYLVLDEQNDVCTVISVSSLLSNHEIMVLDLPSSALKKINNMSSIELGIIKKSLKQLDDEKKSSELVKKIILKLKL